MLSPLVQPFKPNIKIANEVFCLPEHCYAALVMQNATTLLEGVFLLHTLVGKFALRS